MNRFLSRSIALLALASAAFAQGFGPAATVNGVEISRQKVEAQTNHQVNARGMGSGGITQPGTYAQIQQEVMDQLIVQELLWQEAQRRDFIASDEDVDQQMQKLKRDFDTERAFLFKIKEGGFTEETYRANIREQKSVQRMVADGIAAAIEITDEEVAEFYVANLNLMTVPEQIRARHILINVPADDETAKVAAQEKIAAVQKELAEGAGFALLAMQRSEGPSANQGGDLGFFGRGQMVPAFEEVAFAMQPGEISEVVETQFGYHVIKLEERQEGRVVSVAEASERIRPHLTQQRLQETVEKLVEDLRASAEIYNAMAR